MFIKGLDFFNLFFQMAKAGTCLAAVRRHLGERPKSIPRGRNNVVRRPACRASGLWRPFRRHCALRYCELFIFTGRFSILNCTLAHVSRNSRGRECPPKLKYESKESSRFKPLAIFSMLFPSFCREQYHIL